MQTHTIRSSKKGRFSGPCFITCFQIVRFIAACRCFDRSRNFRIQFFPVFQDFIISRILLFPHGARGAPFRSPFSRSFQFLVCRYTLLTGTRTEKRSSRRRATRRRKRACSTPGAFCASGSVDKGRRQDRFAKVLRVLAATPNERRAIAERGNP